MLQSNFHKGSLGSLDDGISHDHGEEGGIGELINLALGFVQRRYRLILLATALALSASVIYLRITPPTYTGQAQILFTNSRAQFVQQQSMLAEPPIDVAQIESRIQILKSKAIALSVINQLRLADEPDFNGSRPSPSELLHRIQAWLIAFPSEPALESDDPTPDKTIAAFQDRLSVNRIGYSNVIEINFNSSSPTRAAEIANAVAKAYIADQMNEKLEANQSATSWLQTRLRELNQQAEAAERAVDKFKAQNNIFSSGGVTIGEQRVTELNARLVAARAQTSDAAARLHQLESILSANSADSLSIGTLDASGSDALNNPIITSLRQKYLDFARKESEFAWRYGKDHQAVISLRVQMQQIRTSILDEVTRLAETSKSDFEVAKQRQQAIEKQLADAISMSRTTNSAELTMQELQGKAKGYRSLYESFLQRYMGSIQQESFPIPEARLISPASPPQGKSKPKSSLILALGLFGGAALGMAIGLLRDAMDRVFRTTSQIEAELRLRCLSLVPRVSATRPRRRLVSKLLHQPRPAPQQRTMSAGSTIYQAVVGMPLSRFVESIYSIKLAIDLSPTKTSNKVVGITSSLPNEGKSTIAATLAHLIGLGGKKVIIVDCDLRNPSLSTNVAPNASAGIVEVAAGLRSLEDTVWSDPKTGVVLLPTTRAAQSIHSSDILSSEQTRKLFDKLRATFDYIIVDLPPLSPIVDVRATTPLIDCFVLVVEWGQTKIDVVQHALHTAPDVYDSTIGAVLNKTNIKSMRKYDNYLSDYYSNKHYERYRLVDHH